LLHSISQMKTRKLLNFFQPRIPQQPEPLPNAGISDAEFDWPPSAEDLEAFSVVHLRADDGSELEPVLLGLSDA
jgi:hypothetical protein